jgi:L-ascorbate metabolism protein UlaG (beta-lactamase superfamily)
MERTALLFGASSQTGAELLLLLLSSDAYGGVTILVRNTLLVQHPKLKQFEVDFDDEGSYANYLAADDIYYCMGCGTTDKEAFVKVELDYTLEIAGEAFWNGAKQFMYLSAYGANENSRVFYLKIKGKTERALGTLGYQALHIFRPSMLSGNKDYKRISQRVFALISQYFNFMFFGPLRNLKTLKAKTLAEAMLNIALAERRGINSYDADQIRQASAVAVLTPKRKYAAKIILTLLCLSFITACSLNLGRVYKGPVSDHFDGTHFYHGEKDVTFSEEMKWFLHRKPAKWPDSVTNKKYPLPSQRVYSGIRVTFVNHATVLIQMAGLNILTDPVWSERASPVSFAGTKRVRQPGLAFNDLPPIDVILISHNHYDHMDVNTLNRLVKKFNPLIYMGLGVSTALNKKTCKRTKELDWWQGDSVSFRQASFTFVPSRHNSQRSLFDVDKTLWGGFVISSASGSVYFAGDTGFGKCFEEIHKRYPSFDVALLPIGGYAPRWIMYSHHMDPDDAVKAHQLLHVRQSIGIHFGTFKGLTDEAIDDPQKQLKIALKAHQVDSTCFRALDFGECLSVKTANR